MPQDVFDVDTLVRETRDRGEPFFEFLRREALSAGMYVLPGGGTDTQVPHREDEIYVVTRGTGRISIEGRTHDVGPGKVIFVAALDEHRFHDFSEDLEILVIFGPAYSGRPSQQTPS